VSVRTPERPRAPSVGSDVRFVRLVRSVLFVALAPWSHGTGADFRIYVSNERSGDVSVCDGATLAPLFTLPVGQRPRGLYLSPDGRWLFVATSGSPRQGPGADPEHARSPQADKSADGLAVIDLQENRVVRRLAVGSDPEEFAFSRDGRHVIVANEDIAAVSIWDVQSGERLARSPVSEEPEGVSLHPTRDEAWIACEEEGDVFIVSVPNGQPRRHLRLGGRPRTIRFDRDGTFAYVPLETGAAIAMVETNPLQLVGKIPLPPPALPMASALSPDGHELYVSTGRGNQVVVIDLTKREVIASIPVGARSWGLGLSPDGSRLFTANGASNDVSVIDVRERRELQRVPAGAGPWGIAIGPSSGANSSAPHAREFQPN